LGPGCLYDERAMEKLLVYVISYHLIDDRDH
jgi:hypothetical protein